MEFFKIRRDIPFMRHALAFNVVSLVTFLLAVFFLATKGLNFSIEFTGGTVMEVHYQQTADVESVRKALAAVGFQDAQVQNFGTSRDILIRLPLKRVETDVNKSTARQSEQVFAELTKSPSPGEAQACAPMHDLFRELVKLDERERPKEKLDQLAKQRNDLIGKCTELSRVEFVGPQVGRELAENGALALLITSLGIVGYLALRFEWKFGVAAIIANLHDVVIILGFFSLFQWEFSLPVLAAVLAVLGYSVNESVVIADRIRENFRKMRKASVTEIIDSAITRTISRTIITHGCTQTMVTSMLVFGGPALHYFALALTIGILFGIYSSVLVMAPIVRWLGIAREDLVKPLKEKKEEAVV
ncbi:MAG TPA: protein translocase subunit SecF [Burkholderiales bacterium]